jgi:hypothetical protein
VTSVFDQQTAPAAAPVTMTPEAAAKGGPDSTGAKSLDVLLSIGASIGTLADTLTQDRADRAARERPPGDNQIFKAGIAPSSGNLILDLGGVPLGQVWQVRRLIIGGVDVTTTAAGKAYTFSQGGPPSDLALTDCVGIYAALPAIEKFGTHQLFLLPSEHLWVVVAGGSSGQQYAASARVEAWDETTFRSTFVE